MTSPDTLHDEPPYFWRGPPEALPGLRLSPIELSSCGDVVPGQLLLPADEGGPWPLVVAQLDLQDGATRQEWARAGAAVAWIDLPLSGARTSPKLAAFADADAELALDVRRQGVADLRRLLRALVELAEIDGGRVALVGLGRAAELGALCCAQEPGVAGAVLGPFESGAQPDAADALERLGPRLLERTDSAEAAWARVSQRLGIA